MVASTLASGCPRWGPVNLPEIEQDRRPCSTKSDPTEMTRDVNVRHIGRNFDLTSAISDSIVMSKTSSIPFPAAHALRKLGRDLALARRRRGISTTDMAARLFVSRDTLWRLERGDPTVALGTLVTATFVLQLHERLANLAAPANDELALDLDERRLPQRIRRQPS